MRKQTIVTNATQFSNLAPATQPTSPLNLNLI